MFKLIFTDQYEKTEQQFLNQHPELLDKYRSVLLSLEINPRQPSLRLHQLKGKLKKYHAVSINLSYRITLELIITKQEIIPIAVGTHDNVYGR
ncbi:type II toxin-antitoxin system YafQ family toxin [Undibacterium sp. Tian12W]|uniref:type II toxin-antitoxin system RelE/ParE family toxin n=1 Tax=Undibacterium sp. Tian12W TaxID=3413054 RepID=UPI003BF0EE19